MTSEDATTITLDTRLQRNNDIASAEADGEAVMMSIEQGAYYGANKMGTRIWDMLEQPMQVSAICEQLLEEFDVQPDQCHADVLAYLEHLNEHKLVQVP